MALVGKFVIENFSYGVSEAELPLFEEDQPLLDEDGEQQTVEVKMLTIEPHPGAQLEIRIAKAEWDDFLAVLAEVPRVIPADLEDLREATSA